MQNGGTVFPRGLSLAILGVEPDYGFVVARGGGAIVFARAGAQYMGRDLARALEDVPIPEHLNTTIGARAYAQAISEHLGGEISAGAGVDLLVMHREEAGLGGYCIGSVGVWTLSETLRRCTPDRTVGAQLRAMGRPVDDKTANLLTTRISPGKVHGGDVWYGGGERFVAVVGWPLPDLSPMLPSLMNQDSSDVIGTVSRLVHRDCALHSGLVGVWDFKFDLKPTD